MASRPEEILAAIRALSKGERIRLVDQLCDEFGDKTSENRTTEPDSVLGLFADDPEAIDQVCAAAMTARERDSLRLADG